MAKIEVTWAQFEAPNHCPGVPTDPADPLFGKGCGCGCGCGSCGAPPEGPRGPRASSCMPVPIGQTPNRRCGKSSWASTHWGTGIVTWRLIP